MRSAFRSACRLSITSGVHTDSLSTWVVSAKTATPELDVKYASFFFLKS